MYFSNGYVYGGTPKEMLKVVSVRVVGDKMLLLKYSSEEERVFDASILQGEVFHPLDDPEVFKQAYVEHGTVTWNDGEIDCSPEYMYEHSEPYEKELKKSEVV